jgi:calcineurin-like phosphoesterase family protein
MKIFFTSDLHCYHKNKHGGIVSICNRPYPDVDTMTQDLINKNNEIVTDSDEVWDLGDLAYRCSPWDVTQVLRELNGKRHIILGNHDQPLRLAYKKGLIKDFISSGKIEIIGGEEAIYDKSLIVAKQITIDGQRIVMSHYAYRTWPSAFRGTILLYGHSHGNLPEPFFKSFDVGVDKNNFYPWSWEKIKTKIEKIVETFKEK